MMTNDDVIKELKKRIAISNFSTEVKRKNFVLPNFLNDWSEMKMNNRKFSNVLATLILGLLIIGAGTGIYAKRQWDIQYKEYQSREYEIGFTTVKDANDSGYTENIDMDYIFQDNIGAKVNSLLITDNYFESKIQFQFPEDLQLNTETFTYGFAIYDEDNNIYAINIRPHWGDLQKYDPYPKSLCKELGTIFPATFLADGGGANPIEATEQSILTKIKLTSTVGFPKSKKLYIRVFDLGYHMYELLDETTLENEMENFDITDSEWIFEIDVPEKFYERKTTILKLENDIPNLEIDKITVSEINLIVEANINDFTKTINDVDLQNQADFRNQLINITDENGNVYYEKSEGLVASGDLIRMQFDINKKAFEDNQFYLNFSWNGKNYSSKILIDN